MTEPGAIPPVRTRAAALRHEFWLSLAVAASIAGIDWAYRTIRRALP